MFRLDDRVLGGLEAAARNAGFSSVNRFVEVALFNLLKMSGAISAEEVPLPETRGCPKGERRGGRKKSIDRAD